MCISFAFLHLHVVDEDVTVEDSTGIPLDVKKNSDARTEETEHAKQGRGSDKCDAANNDPEG